MQASACYPYLSSTAFYNIMWTRDSSLYSVLGSGVYLFVSATALGQVPVSSSMQNKPKMNSRGKRIWLLPFIIGSMGYWIWCAMNEWMEKWCRRWFGNGDIQPHINTDRRAMARSDLAAACPTNQPLARSDDSGPKTSLFSFIKKDGK